MDREDQNRVGSKSKGLSQFEPCSGCFKEASIAPVEMLGEFELLEVVSDREIGTQGQRFGDRRKVCPGMAGCIGVHL